MGTHPVLPGGGGDLSGTLPHSRLRAHPVPTDRTVGESRYCQGFIMFVVWNFISSHYASSEASSEEKNSIRNPDITNAPCPTVTGVHVSLGYKDPANLYPTTPLVSFPIGELAGTRLCLFAMHSGLAGTRSQVVS